MAWRRRRAVLHSWIEFPDGQSVAEGFDLSPSYGSAPGNSQLPRGGGTVGSTGHVVGQTSWRRKGAVSARVHWTALEYSARSEGKCCRRPLVCRPARGCWCRVEEQEMNRSPLQQVARTSSDRTAEGRAAALCSDPCAWPFTCHVTGGHRS